MAEGHRPGHGKIARCEAILRTYAPQVGPDLWHYFHVDLRDLYRPGGGASRLTYRLLDDFLGWLPPESATKTAMRDAMDPVELAELAKEPQDGYGPWSGERSMLAEIRDSIEKVVYAVIRVNGGKVSPPEPYPRPGVVRSNDANANQVALDFQKRLNEAREARRPLPSPTNQKEAAVLYLDRLRQAHAARQADAARNPPAPPARKEAT